MKSFLLILLLILTVEVQAQLVQVPENCINRVSPCLVRSEDRDFQFMHRGQAVKLLKESIVKISFDENQNNFELLEGRITLDEKDKSVPELLINSKAVRSGQLYASRFGKNLKILDFKDFVLSEYLTSAQGAEPQQLKSDFINKQDFIEFTKHYYSSTAQYKSFLVSIESDWKQEFKKQNNSQTKVLMRSIASEQAEAKREAEIKARNAEELKKVRDTFFYRTFER
ncbi:MAG: hypothetical protein ABL930_05470 [Pseudobdellovibrio sp.]